MSFSSTFSNCSNTSDTSNNELLEASMILLSLSDEIAMHNLHRSSSTDISFQGSSLSRSKSCKLNLSSLVEPSFETTQQIAQRDEFDHVAWGYFAETQQS